MSGGINLESDREWFYTHFEYKFVPVNLNTLLIRMDHYFWPKFAKLDPTHESGQAFESGPA